jgi:hypothetical protein
VNSKVAFRDTLRLMNAGRPVFTPFVYGLAAKIGLIPLREMVSDATYYTHSLEEAYKLLKYDGIVNNFDSTLEAETFGCELDWPGDYVAPQIAGCGKLELREVNLEESCRIPILLETTKRIVMSQGKEIAVIGVLTGPCSLVKTITSDEVQEKNLDIENVISLAGSLLTKLTRSLCELRVDAVFFKEDLLGAEYPSELLSRNKPYAAVYTTLFNLIKYYNCYPVLIAKDIELNFITELHKMIGPNGLILLGKRVSGDDLASLQKLSDSLKMSFGLPLPMGSQAELLEQFSIISDFISKHRPPGFFYVSDDEIPYDMPLETIHDLIAKMRNI